jgi:hypothetical protein
MGGIDRALEMVGSIDFKRDAPLARVERDEDLGGERPSKGARRRPLKSPGDRFYPLSYPLKTRNPR